MQYLNNPDKSSKLKQLQNIFTVLAINKDTVEVEMKAIDIFGKEFIKTHLLYVGESLNLNWDLQENK